MTLRLDSVRLAVPDVDATIDAYRVLLGVEPVGCRFQLGRGAVELEAGESGRASLRFTTDEPVASPPAFHGLDVRIEPDGEHAPARGGPVLAIDHVVVHTPAPERAIAVWRDGLGLRLALDRVFAERGLRLLFFRSNGITLEYASPHPAPPPDGDDRFYGLSYRVADLAAHCARLAEAGVDVSPIRRGMRRGTSVASVRSGTAGVPTLLLVEDEPPATS